ncbi:peptidase C14 caspase catalytic subunit p20 [Candidatus Moduliflexus flocculans]|uniref:Peptidase C14 caspase catalytic subunit p20 n=1 Tax=Candidatus Moduliflexus flocculans TaxID=1499966 RepID=A0A0S6W5V7_9BACT|nr:peptidase C14 caspase catalytic subunit p20 [Candidatus Moduliflexus flocculans]
MRQFRKFFIILASMALSLLAGISHAERLALVIGNNAYEESPLTNPVNDANDMAAALQRLGFSVNTQTNITKREMEDAIRDFTGSLKSSDTALFYFSGHGAQVDGINYLVPVGARIVSERDIKYESVAAELVLDYLERAGNRLNIVILDACRDNPFKGFRSTRGGLAMMTSPTGTLIGYATAPGTVAYDGPGQNSPYTKHLLKAMTTPGLRIEDVFKQARVGVMVETGNKQVPWESSSLIGDFYFTRQDQREIPSAPDEMPNTDLRPSDAKIPDGIDPSIPITPGEGVGDLRLDMSADDVRRLLGEPEHITDLYQDGNTLYFEYYSYGIMAHIQADRVIAIYLYSGVDGGYDEDQFKPFPGMTKEGVSVLSMKDEILNMYGTPIETAADPENSQIMTERLYYPGIGFKYATLTGQIIHIRIARQAQRGE